MSERVIDLVHGLVRGQQCNGRCVYDKQAKRELVRRCQQSGVSVAAMALALPLKANLLRKWTEWLDGPLRSNSAAFYSEGGDIVIGAVGTAPGGAFATLSADTGIYGIELEMSAAATERLDLFVTVG